MYHLREKLFPKNLSAFCNASLSIVWKLSKLLLMFGNETIVKIVKHIKYFNFSYNFYQNFQNFELAIKFYVRKKKKKKTQCNLRNSCHLKESPFKLSAFFFIAIFLLDISMKSKRFRTAPRRLKYSIGCPSLSYSKKDIFVIYLFIYLFKVSHLYRSNSL